MRTPTRGPRARLLAVTIFAAIALAGCGDSPSGPGSGNVAATGQVNGASWSAAAIGSNAQLSPANNQLTVSLISADSYSMAITVGPVTGPATVQFNAVSANFAVVTTLGGGSWGSLYGGAGGSITLTTFTQDRVAGSFSFTANPAPGSAVAGTLTINGQFDLPLIRH